MKNRIILIILSIVLVISVFVINIYSHVEKKNKNHTTTKVVSTTSKRTDDLKDNERIIKLTIEGQEEEVIVKNYSSHLGFNFDYDVDMFNPVLLSNGSVIVNDMFNSNIYVQFEKLSEADYYASYESLNGVQEVSEDGYLSTYSYFRGNNIYLKVTKRIYNSTEYLSGINVRLDYIIGSLQFN